MINLSNKKITLIITTIVLLLLWFTRAEIKDYYYSQNFIYWSKNVEIKHSDYEDSINHSSKSNVWYFHRMYIKSNKLKHAYVHAVFDKSQSWVKDTMNYDFQKENELQKIRFDLYKVYAEKFNHEIDKIRFIENKKYSDIIPIGNRIYAEIEELEYQIYSGDFTISERISKWRPILDDMLNKKTMYNNTYK